MPYRIYQRSPFPGDECEIWYECEYCTPEKLCAECYMSRPSRLSAEQEKMWDLHHIIYQVRDCEV